jgi:hypothetical protein
VQQLQCGTFRRFHRPANSRVLGPDARGSVQPGGRLGSGTCGSGVTCVWCPCVPACASTTVGCMLAGLQTDCAPGKWSSVVGLASPCTLDCPPGYYCPAGTFNTTNNPCGGAQFFCPAGSSAAQTSGVGNYTVGSSSPLTRSSQLACPAPWEPGMEREAVMVACPVLAVTFGPSPWQCDRELRLRRVLPWEWNHVQLLGWCVRQCGRLVLCCLQWTLRCGILLWYWKHERHSVALWRRRPVGDWLCCELYLASRSLCVVDCSPLALFCSCA